MKLAPNSIAVAALLAAAPAWADLPDSTSRGGFLVQTRAEFGGDELAVVEFEDGEEQEIRAGQGFAVGIGGYFRPAKSAPGFELQGILGYKFATTTASNADIHVSRVTLDVSAVYTFDNGMYVLGGIAHHMDPQLNGDDFFEDIRFDDATGFNAAIGWRWFELRYTKIEYENYYLEPIDASSIGISLTWRFGAKLGY